MVYLVYACVHYRQSLKNKYSQNVFLLKNIYKCCIIHIQSTVDRLNLYNNWGTW